MAQQKTALIVGMAKSGIAAARLLYENGYRVIINDMKPEIKGLFDALSGIAYEVRLGDDPMDLLDGVDLLIPSPIIPFFRPFIVEAKRRGIEVISEITSMPRRFAATMKGRKKGMMGLGMSRSTPSNRSMGSSPSRTS